ncbi:MAG: type I phosphomannose isomerase catalytic subunit [Flavobacteriales bacterium AspAUS03]
MPKVLYPLRFHPIFQYRIWGGTKLKEILGKKVPQKRIGESWELSDVAGHLSIVANGPLAWENIKTLIERYQGELVGEKVYQKFETQFPLLIKFIDAQEPLSIQVHPGDDLAKKRHNSFGKNEMWYIMQADEKAKLIMGFNQAASQEQYFEWIEKGETEKYLNKIPVQKGQVYYLPAGRIHAIGAGILIAEIQQTSDVTYRIYDYNRSDKDGKQRKLHITLAADAIDFSLHDTYQTSYQLVENQFSEVLNTPYFRTNILSIRGKIEKDYTDQDCFTILIAVEGTITVKTLAGTEEMKAGEILLLPASIAQVRFESFFGGKLLEVTL